MSWLQALPFIAVTITLAALFWRDDRKLRSGTPVADEAETWLRNHESSRP